MWIRTQDKETLLNVNCIDMYNLNKYEWIIEACGNDLGTYESKERAIKVLDEIQAYLENNYLSISDMPQHNNGLIANGLILFPNNNKQTVYQMPKE